MKPLPLIVFLLAAGPVFGGIISTPFALEMRQRNSVASNYISPNLYATPPPGNAPGIILYTGNSDIEAVILGTGLQWTPEDPLTSTPGRLDVTVAGGVNADWNAVSGAAQILNKPTLFDGAWTSLTGKPSFATVATSGAYADLSGKPTLFSGAYADLTGKPTLGTAAATASTDYATAAQGALAGTALQPAAIGVTVQAAGSYATTAALASGLAGKFNTPAGTTGQYLRGDGSLATFPTIPTVPSVVSAFTNDSGYITSAALSPYATTAALTSGLAG